MGEVQDVRVRFAPSPTGWLHIGGARTALYNWLFARRHGGAFVLRIEDTDQTRSTEEAVGQILDSMRWLGLDWDEELTYQSGRLPIYQARTEELLERGLAFEDEDERGTAVRLKVLRQDSITVADGIHGNVQFDVKLIEDFVIRKADGFPTYNFACVVDDHEMAITHVIRGDDHISNTPRQLLIAEALGWPPPKFAHVPMILGEDGRRLSKRHGAMGVNEYRDMGYLPEALLNFLALLGWSPGDDREVFTRQGMIDAFSLDRVGATASRFDPEKLLWLNSRHIQGLGEDDLAGCIAVRLEQKFGLSPGDDACRRLARACRERLRTFADLDQYVPYLFADDVSWNPQTQAKAFKNVPAREVLETCLSALEALDGWDEAPLEQALRGVAQTMEIGFKKVAQPLRYAVCGTTVGPPLFDTLILIGRRRVLARLRRTIAQLEAT